jgi:hypothetical protein
MIIARHIDQSQIYPLGGICPFCVDIGTSCSQVYQLFTILSTDSINQVPIKDD